MNVAAVMSFVDFPLVRVKYNNYMLCLAYLLKNLRVGKAFVSDGKVKATALSAAYPPKHSII